MDHLHHNLFSQIVYHYIDGLVQDCTLSSVLAMEILQFRPKPSISLCVLILHIRGRSW